MGAPRRTCARAALRRLYTMHRPRMRRARATRQVPRGLLVLRAILTMGLLTTALLSMALLTKVPRGLLVLGAAAHARLRGARPAAAERKDGAAPGNPHRHRSPLTAHHSPFTLTLT